MEARPDLVNTCRGQQYIRSPHGGYSTRHSVSIWARERRQMSDIKELGANTRISFILFVVEGVTDNLTRPFSRIAGGPFGRRAMAMRRLAVQFLSG
jgi:hypothetical protein